ncbi:MAG: hypothetical protein R3C56_00550 [Pirellulaceae bacterium]
MLKAETDSPLFADGQQPSVKRIESARQLRRREHILAAARNIASASARDSETKFTVAQAKQLVPFRDEYRGQDPEFVNRFGQACVRLAACQENPDAFDMLVPQVPGPAHDPHWNLENFKYALNFSDSEEWVEEAADDYLKQDLTKSSAPEPVKQALASLLRMTQARYLVDQQSSAIDPFGFMSAGGTDYKSIEKLLGEAISSTQPIVSRT